MKRKTEIGPNTLLKVIQKALCFFENKKKKINQEEEKNNESFVFEYKYILFNAKIINENLELVVVKNRIMPKEKKIGDGTHGIIYKSIRLKQHQQDPEITEK